MYAYLPPRLLPGPIYNFFFSYNSTLINYYLIKPYNERFRYTNERRTNNSAILLRGDLISFVNLTGRAINNEVK